MKLFSNLFKLIQPDSDISAYTYERTLMMEQRNEMVSEMRKSTRRKGKGKKTVSGGGGGGGGGGWYAAMSN